MEAAMEMREAWRQLWRGSGVDSNASAGAYERLRWYYDDDARHYHNMRHIGFCLELFYEVSQLAIDPFSVQLAIWYHDVMYDTHRSDNEKRSGTYGDMEIRQLLQPLGRATHIGRLVMATRHVTPASNLRTDEKLLCDIDLAGLALPRMFFERDTANIRKEYFWVSEADFRVGRAKILQRFLNREHIYHLPYFKARYERRARENLARSITELTA